MSRVTGLLARAIEDPGKEYRRQRWRRGLPIYEELPEGVGIFLYPGERLSELIWCGHFEPAVRNAVRSVLRPGMTFVDAGANLGLYTVIAAKLVGGSGRVFAFEPSEREWRRAQRTIRANHLHNVELFRAAVGDVDGRVSLTVCDDSCGAYNSIGKVTHADAIGHVSHVEEVTCRSLDSFLAAAGVRRVDVVKIDVEGAEELVLRGGRQLFSSVDGPMIFCELSDRCAPGLNSSAARVLELLKEYGYAVHEIVSDRDLCGVRPQSERRTVDYEEIVAWKPHHGSQLKGKL